MKINEQYGLQAKLVVSVLRHIARENIFALKGGTAINFFVQNFPRLSVDIDLAYIGFEKRAEAINIINSTLDKMVNDLKRVNISSAVTTSEGDLKRIVCSNSETKIKIDMNYTARGYAYPPIIKPLNIKLQKEFGELEMQLLSIAELYGGKICAALNRQHPRDLFDIKILFDNEGITEEIKNGFIVCLLGDNGSPYELLAPNIKDQREVLRINFDGMTDIKFTYQDHEKTLQKLIKTLHKSLTKADKDFILGFFSLKPKWDLIDIPNIQKLSAVQWKIKNLEKMSKEKLEEHLQKTKEALNI